MELPTYAPASSGHRDEVVSDDEIRPNVRQVGEASRPDLGQTDAQALARPPGGMGILHGWAQQNGGVTNAATSACLCVAAIIGMVPASRAAAAIHPAATASSAFRARACGGNGERARSRQPIRACHSSISPGEYSCLLPSKGEVNVSPSGRIFTIRPWEADVSAEGGLPAHGRLGQPRIAQVAPRIGPIQRVKRRSPPARSSSTSPGLSARPKSEMPSISIITRIASSSSAADSDCPPSGQLERTRA